MGLEAATYIDGLVSSNPLGGDPKSAGDDHFRLIKSALKNTFPGLNRPIYFNGFGAVAVDTALTATAMNQLISVDASVTNREITLPAGLVAGDAGFWVDVMRSDSDMTKRCAVKAASGNIDGLATIGLWMRFAEVRFMWTGSAWLPMRRRKAGTVESFDGVTVPDGYLALFGQEISRTLYAELFAAVGTTWGVGNGTTTFNVGDRRGRVDAGQDDMGGTSANRLTTTLSGLNGDTLGAVGGGESQTLALTQIPSHPHGPGTLVAADHRHNMFINADSPQLTELTSASVQVPKTTDIGSGASGIKMAQAAGEATLGRTGPVIGTLTVSGATSAAGGGDPHANVQPTAISNRIISLG